MVKIWSYMNHGRWLVDCPKCGNASEINRQTKTLICLHCDPGIQAMAFQEVDTPVQGKILRQIPDIMAREAARQKATQYDIVFPKEAEEIEKAITGKHQYWQNWYPDRKEIRALHPTASAFGQTVAQLKAEVTRGL